MTNTPSNERVIAHDSLPKGTSLRRTIAANIDQDGDKTAVRYRGSTYSYRGLLVLASQLRDMLNAHGGIQKNVPILTCSRSPLFANMFNLLLGLEGIPYEPLSLNEPFDRAIAKASKWQNFILLTDTHTESELGPISARASLTVIADEDLSYRTHQRPENAGENHLSLDECVYILSTSGSTGVPKSVPIKSHNLYAYLSAATRFFGVEQDEHFSVIHDVCFDFNIHELYLPIHNHGCLCIADKSDLLSPATVSKFVERHGVTFWSCVPSFINHLDHLRKFNSNTFNRIRKTMICGEALTLVIQQAWRALAPNSRIFNLYGPTECTVSVSGKDITYPQQDDIRNGVLTIGEAWDNTLFYVLNEGHISQEGRGELLVGGPQVFDGYFREGSVCREKLVEEPQSGQLLYRTGDNVELSPNKPNHYLGRGDDQLQIRGHRIQKNEILHLICQTIPCSNLAVVEKNSCNGTTIGIVLFISGENLQEVDIRRRLAATLPSYALPLKINIGPLPMNKNMKIDHKKLYSHVNPEAETS
ncbi:peptide synthetase [Enterovibrio norvegicus]|uniref:AMP-binding protein n=1 Tax=Enterovibrio norvegicus TaxID=188144 RepID=UPI0002E5DF3D|nr:AMP-binding protein [Enterovibrio norvegicus]OEF49760.1 peptide synthetase [Enterovibrio norvegicus]